VIVELNTLEPPEEITNVEREEITSELICNIQQGLANPLTSAISQRRDGGPAAMRFSLRSYRKAANEVRNKLAEATLRRPQLAARNKSNVEGGKAEPNLQHVNELAPEAERVIQAKLYSNNAFLKAIGLLEARRKEGSELRHNGRAVESIT
jgi:hypothetical protein